MAESNKETSNNQEAVSKKQFPPRKEGETPQEYYPRAFFEFLKSDVENSKNKDDLLERLKETSKITGETNGDKEEQSTIDSLTKLYNKRGFEENIKSLERFKKEGKKVSVCRLDVDGLKIINDTLGHGAGDELLKLLAGVIKSVKRPYDVAARWLGEDEFDIGILGSLEEANKLIKRIEEGFGEAVKNSFENSGFANKLGFTFALGEWQQEENIQTVMKRVDDELIMKKKSKKENG